MPEKPLLLPIHSVEAAGIVFFTDLGLYCL